MLSAPIIATIRTGVPALVGLLLSVLISRYGPVSEAGLQLAEQWTVALITAITVGYYLLVTFLERRVWSGFGWLLGVAAAPSYPVEASRNP
jgi:ABC-type tungstate transport system substrate-binding protein